MIITVRAQSGKELLNPPEFLDLKRRSHLRLLDHDEWRRLSAEMRSATLCAAISSHPWCDRQAYLFHQQYHLRYNWDCILLSARYS